MITLTREEAQQVLDALNSCGEDWIADGEWETRVDDYDHELVAKALETLRARLAQPEPEPQEAIAKWIKTNTEHRQWYICPKCSYQAPRFKDEWQGLTDEEIMELLDYGQYGRVPEYARNFVDAIEAKLKEKNT